MTELLTPDTYEAHWVLQVTPLPPPQTFLLSKTLKCRYYTTDITLNKTEQTQRLST